MLTEIVGGIVSPVLKIIDKVVPDQAERDRIKLEFLKQENQNLLEQTRLELSAILAEEQSPDPWTSRARPTFLYVIYFVILSCMFGGIVGIWFPESMNQAANNINALLRAIPDSLWSLFGVGYLGYTGARSVEKWKMSTK
ncbi:MAG: holin family protein [Alphaproteobacteria bacterium]|nr:holin family protein [Alphaproteobacteria bacterium]